MTPHTHDADPHRACAGCAMERARALEAMREHTEMWEPEFVVCVRELRKALSRESVGVTGYGEKVASMQRRCK